jgi:hypothetical protein
MKLAVLVLAGSLAVSAQGSALSKAQSDQFQRKLQTIVAQGNTTKGSDGNTARRTPVMQSEVNSYLKFEGPTLLPVGVTDASVAAHGAGRLSGRAVVDLDAVRQKKSSGGWFDPRSYLTGSLPVTAAGTLHTKDGEGRFELESAAISGVPIPKSLLQELVSYYTRSADHPNGVSIDDAFELPASIREIQVGEGNAIVVQ